jgi:type III secretion protein D
MDGWKKIKSRIATDIPRIRTLTDRVVPPGQRSIPAPPKPGIESAPTAAVAEVKPTESPMPSVAAEAATTVATATAPTVNGVTMAIRSVTVGQSRSLVLVSGERLFEGAVLPSGHTLKSIASDRIVLEKMGEETVIPLKGGT